MGIVAQVEIWKKRGTNWVAICGFGAFDARVWSEGWGRSGGTGSLSSPTLSVKRLLFALPTLLPNPEILIHTLKNLQGPRLPGWTGRLV